MRYLCYLFLLVTVTAFSAPASSIDVARLRPRLLCSLGDGKQIELLVQSHGIDGDSLFLKTDGKIQTAFLDMPQTEFTGHVVMSRCVHKTLVFALDYGPPYLKGVAIRQNPITHSVERIDFAEKNLPRWLLLGREEMLVIFPNEGYETNKRYLIYRHVAGQGQAKESLPTDRLPIPEHNLIRIN